MINELDAIPPGPELTCPPQQEPAARLPAAHCPSGRERRPQKAAGFSPVKANSCLKARQKSRICISPTQHLSAPRGVPVGTDEPSPSHVPQALHEQCGARRPAARQGQEHGVPPEHHCPACPITGAASLMAKQRVASARGEDQYHNAHQKENNVVKAGF